MLTNVPGEQIRGVLDRCAEDLLWEAGVAGPPVDAFRVAHRLGMVITGDAAMTTRARFARLATEHPCGGVETIVLGQEDREERRQFAVAHEVGEARAYRVYESLGVDPSDLAPESRERIANALAGRLLVPRRWLITEWRESDGDLFALKGVFRTASHELIARRALECASIPLIVTVTDNERMTWRRANLPGATPSRTPLEIDCQMGARTTAEPVCALGRDDPLAAAPPPLARVRSWPIHEPGWRREITFSEPQTAEAPWF